MSGERFRQARELRGLTQTELANRIGVNQSNIAHVESGVMEASDVLIRAVAFQTGFPVSHFQQDDPPEFTYGSLLFRSRVAMGAQERRVAYRYGQTAFELAEKLGRRLRTPPLALPRISEPPKIAAAMMRSALGIPPDAPISKLINTLERHGVIILASPVPPVAHDAYSLWAGTNRERAVMIIAAGLPGDRLRFSVGHELRHLTYPATGTRQEIERDADVFSAEFLMPDEAMRAEILPPVTLAGLARLKPKWGVSIQALAKRAVDLAIINDRRYRYLMQQIGMRGWRTSEPPQVAVERPRGLRQMAEHLYGKPIDYSKLAADVRLSTALVRELIELHAGKVMDRKPSGKAGKVLDINDLRPPRVQS